MSSGLAIRGGTCETRVMLSPGMARNTPKRPRVFIRPEAMEFFREKGRRGGKKGGKARWEGVPPEERSEILRRAALARWRKKK
jgi:hypothetical protein